MQINRVSTVAAVEAAYQGTLLSCTRDTGRAQVDEPVKRMLFAEAINVAIRKGRVIPFLQVCIAAGQSATIH